MRAKSLVFLIVTVIFCLLHSKSVASEQPNLNCDVLANKKYMSNLGDGFLKGTQELHTYASVLIGDSGKGEMYALHVGYGYFLRDRLSINIDTLSAYIRSGIDDNGAAIGLDVLFREHFYTSHDDLCSVYLEAGSGLQQQSTNFSGRRHFNFEEI
jgi:hypothetical protein